MAEKAKRFLKILNFNIFLKGLFMGTADMMPGISGGTVAFILGIYDELLLSIKSFNLEGIKALLTFKFSKFFQIVRFKFLASLLLGMGTSILILAKVLHFLLSNDLYKSYLFAFFFGCIFASIKTMRKNIEEWDFPLFISIVSGIAVSSAFLYFNDISYIVSTAYFFDFRLILAGLFAILAMLLPGISGSFVLMIFGVYPMIIASLANLFNISSVLILSNVALGIIMGFALFSRLISWSLKKHYLVTICFLTGLMIGSIKCIWPFFNPVSHKLTAPDLSSYHSYIAIALIFIGYKLFSKIRIKEPEKAV